MFECTGCGEWSMKYDFRTKSFQCEHCHKVEEVEPYETSCPRCGKKYVAYTWFDPSYCSHCNYSFVD